MFQGIFNYDNAFWRWAGKLGTLILLNLLWTVCSLPILTMGAATTAAYDVCLRLARDQEDAPARSFFRAFRNNFRQATVIWLILLAAGLILGFDIWFFAAGPMAMSQMVRSVLTVVLGGIFLLYLLVLLYAFPLQARFDNPVRRTLLNAFWMAAGHLFQTIGILSMDILMLIGAYMILFYVVQLVPVVVLFGVPVIIFANSLLFHGIFQPYTAKEEERNQGDDD